MFSKLIAILATVAAVSAAPQHLEAARFPAGVNPAACPGYPNCDNAALHNPQPQWNQWNAPQPQWNAAPQPQWNPAPQPQWNAAPQPQWNQHAEAAPQWDPNTKNNNPLWNVPAAAQQYNYPALTGPATNHLGSGGDKYPAGVNPHTCPNYPYCDTNAGHAGAVRAAPLPGFTERQYPAGVNPHQCPNFPYCS
uniref:Putative cuticle protein 1 n=1 Tax=Corethrella appendiculata TaxID=1370023 RepID=U5EF00_9DIPT